MKFNKVTINDEVKINELSTLATSIIREYYTPLLGEAQNEYMIELFQSVKGIKKQLEDGYHYYVVNEEDKDIGFIAYKLYSNYLYLSKFYLKKEERNKGFGRKIISHLIDECRRLNLYAIELNVNKYNETNKLYKKLGFKIIKSEINDIGNGYVMDDYVYRYDI